MTRSGTPLSPREYCQPAATDSVRRRFFGALRLSRLLPHAEVDAIERQAGREPLAAVRHRLEADGVLTAYQLARIDSGLADGLVYGQYHVLGELGEGGCGKVYRARHALTDRVVALKVIAPALDRSARVRDLFLREVIATTKLNHPNVAVAYHADEADGQIFLAMEHVDGPTLQCYVASGGPLPPAVAREVLQTARALQHAHENGLVHRDIKPANIMLAPVAPVAPAGSGGPPSVWVKVIDFGLARQRTVRRGVLATIPCDEGSVIGTPAYMAPEQITQVHEADIRADLYSLGCTLYFALTGQLPFNGRSPELVLFQHLSQEPEPLAAVRADVPPDLARIVHRLMAKNPADRYQTPAELIAAATAPRPDGPSSWGGSAWRVDTVDDVAALDSPTERISDVPLVRPDALPPDNPADLRPLWRAWGGVVEGFTRGEPPAVGEADYKSLYRELVRTARSAAVDRAGEVIGLVEPWVTLKALAGLDRRTLDQVWRGFRALDADLWPEPDRPAAHRRVVAFVPALLGLAVAAAWLIRRWA